MLYALKRSGISQKRKKKEVLMFLKPPSHYPSEMAQKCGMLWEITQNVIKNVH